MIIDPMSEAMKSIFTRCVTALGFVERSLYFIVRAEAQTYLHAQSGQPQTDRQTYIQTDRQTYRQTERRT